MSIKCANYVRTILGVSKSCGTAVNNFHCFIIKNDFKSITINYNSSSLTCPQFVLARSRYIRCFSSNEIDKNFSGKDQGTMEVTLQQGSSKSGDETKIKKYLTDFFAFIEKVLHMDEVIKAQGNVMQIKDKLKQSGDRKREILFELNMIREDLKRIHNDIYRSPRGSEIFLELIGEETKILKKEKAKQTEFTLADEVERQNFTNLTNAINDSYEKEKVYSNTLRNLGIIGTLLGSVISFIGATLGYYLHNRKSGLIVQNLQDTLNETIKREIGFLKEELNIDELRRTVKLLERKQSELVHLISKLTNQNQEGWGGYIKRHAGRAYRWVYPAN